MSDYSAQIQKFYDNMQGATGEVERMVELFADDGVYAEPFSSPGTATQHTGIDAVRATLNAGRAQMPDVVVRTRRIDVDGNSARVEWECEAAALPNVMHGVDHFTFRDGKIARLEVTMSMPSATGNG